MTEKQLSEKVFGIGANITIQFLENIAYTAHPTFYRLKEKMTTDKTEETAKKTATNKAPATAKMAAKPVVKPAAKKAVAMPKSAVKKPEKESKGKIVHDCFSMPKAEHLKIAEIKESCLKAGLHVKKSGVLRAGLKALGEMNEAQLKRATAGLEKIKTKRTKKLPKKP